MRPVFFGAELDPPRMSVLLPLDAGEYLIVRGIRIRTPVATLEEAKRAGVVEVRSFTPSQVELLREIAVPATRDELLAEEDLAVTVTVVDQEPRYPGPIFCPLCCRKLGTGDSPSIGYVTKCPGCARRIEINAIGTDVRVTIRYAV